MSDSLPTLRSSLANARSASDRLFECLRPGAIYERAVSERHRFIFYCGHLDAFDWNLLGVSTLGLTPFRPEWDRLFAFGIDPESSDLPTDSAGDWPSEEELRAYCVRTRNAIDDSLESLDPEGLRVAIEHRLMHMETLAYLLHNLDYSLKSGKHDEPLTGGHAPLNSFVPISEGQVTLGQEAGCFGWDNEFPRHTRDVDSFGIQKYKVTNGDYLPFVQEGASAPHFWVRRDEQWMLRGMFSEIPLPLDWPVWTTQAEAHAYAAHYGFRLPSEAEFHRAAFGTPGGEERAFPWGNEAPKASRGNFDFTRWDPCPVDANPCGDSAFGVAQMVGNGWEWTSTPFAPFAGFQPAPYYPGYSANFFDEKHYVLKGASPRTAKTFLRRSFRNWFRGDYRYAFAGFRCVSDD
ncbi:MAG: SUMF1/EgtB/PvdO family nonheme iron enzyme [Bryobacterales bacterium]|nr:SUMF1/EgtB/PvdO family nonheme iron enzyme [Bryobacterales bacterium]